MQANLLHDLGTRVVVPLFPVEKAPKPAKWLNPAFEIDYRSFVMMTQFLASVPERDLKSVVTSLGMHQDEIVQALDLLLTGF